MAGAGGGLALNPSCLVGGPAAPGVPMPTGGLPLTTTAVPLADALPSFEQYLQYLFMSLPPPPTAFYAAAAAHQQQQQFLQEQHQQQQQLLKKQAAVAETTVDDVEEKVDVVSSTPEPVSDEEK